jgi:hypothetical protein
VNRFQFILFCALAAICALGASAQQSFYQRLRSDNASMTEVQPTWMGPLIQSDPRLSQLVRVSVSNADFSGMYTSNYGNGKGISLIVDRRFQLDLDPPAYFRNHSSTQKDGFGNAGTQLKYRIASGNAAHGNFALTAVLYHGFAPRASQNQMLTSYYCPSIAAGKAFGRFAVIETVGGFLPTGMIAQQGRAIEWHSTAQMHVTRVSWFDVEDNATFFKGSAFDGKTRNMITPAVFYMIRRKEWNPEHASVVFDGGMQIATSGFHDYNHNLVTEMRVLF